jgi:hypothetical protein
LYLELGRTYLRLSEPRPALEALAFGRTLRPDPEFSEEMVAGSVSLNLDCPLMHSQLCTASRNVALLYHQEGQDSLAAGTVRGAIGDLGCPAELFR